MSVVKDEVQKLIQSLPEDCTLEDIQYHLYVIEKIQHSIKEMDAGKTVTHKDAKERMQRWLSK